MKAAITMAAELADRARRTTWSQREPASVSGQPDAANRGDTAPEP
jgi:cation diffusion facilitator CzcD-associated flavoprotein CzcO